MCTRDLKKKTPGVCSQAESANVESEMNINFICPRPIHTTSMVGWIKKVVQLPLSLDL